MRSFVAHGESGDANNQAIEENIPKIQEKIAKFETRDVFNADKCRMFYKWLQIEQLNCIEQKVGRKLRTDSQCWVAAIKMAPSSLSLCSLETHTVHDRFEGKLIKSAGPIIISIARRV